MYGVGIVKRLDKNTISQIESGFSNRTLKVQSNLSFVNWAWILTASITIISNSLLKTLEQFVDNSYVDI